MENIEIRMASVDDAEAILKIYEYYVLNTAVSFDYEVPTLDEFKKRIERTLIRFPYFVAVSNNKVVGYSYAGTFIGREAYKYSAELTIYIDKDYRNKGIGQLLYQTLENKLKEMGLMNFYACVGVPVEESDEYLTFDSFNFHEKMGYKKIGEFHKCGNKFGNWYNMIWMEKLIR